MASWAQMEFSEAMSPVMQDFVNFHDHVMLVLIFILTFVGFILMSTIFNSMKDIFLLENQSLEVTWTMIPVVILLYIGAPSLYILYSMDYDYLSMAQEDFYSIKVTGHQWYWSYLEETNLDLENPKESFDSYMIPQSEMNHSNFRLLDVDNRLTVPAQTMIKIMVTSADVLHSWTIPSLGMKVDACPGRLNQMINFIKQPGIFYGQCSEICGANHSFMPIVMEAHPMQYFMPLMLMK